MSAADSIAEGSGVVHLVGAGPGDPGLLTVRARELLDSCDAIVYDALAHPELVQRASVRDDAGAPPPELHFVGKRGGDSDSAKQDDINALLVRLGREGKRVVRLKGGDPLVFGRGSEEAQALADAGVRFEIVPGVTAGIAAPAYAGIPVTHRGLATSVTFVSGHEDPTKPTTTTNWQALAKAGGTIVLYMAVKTLPEIVRALHEGGLSLDTPAAAIQWGTHANQRALLATLGTLVERMREGRLSAPVITVIGAVAALRDEIAWFENRPLFGARVVVTRAAAQAAGLATRLRDLGAEVIEMPATRIEPLDDAPLRDALTRVADYSWLIVTSQNAVQLLWDTLRAMKLDARALHTLRVCAIGPATADALLERGIVADVVPERFVAEGALEALSQRSDVAGSRVLYATAEGARPVLPDGLRALGATVDLIPIYRAAPDGAGSESLRARLERGEVDIVTLTSGSAAQGYVRAVGIDAARRAPSVSIGPITSDAARTAGLDIVGEADEASLPALVDAVTSWWRARATERDVSLGVPRAAEQ
jgi:uroporphyrinogen III methyltransferase/synthase